MKNLICLLMVLGFAGTVHAASTYQCDGVTISGQTLKLIIYDETKVLVDGYMADRNFDYDPRVNFNMNLFLCETPAQGASEVLVEDELMLGAASGHIKVQGHQGSFVTQDFFCHL